MSASRSRSPWIAAVSMALVAACGGQGVEHAPDLPEATVAAYDGGEVTFAEVDAAVVALTPDRRQKLVRGDLEGWKEHVRTLAGSELLASRGRSAGLLDSPQIRQLEQSAHRQALLDACLADRVEIPPPSDDDLREIYRRDPSAWDRPERRFVYHIFRAATEPEARAAATRELEGIRAAVLGGRPFTDFTATSDSETRHRDGVLGWFERGRLSEDFDRVVFGLEEGVASPPVATGAGLHVFYVHEVFPGSRPSFEELRPQLARLWAREARRRSLAALEADVEVPDRIFVADETELEAVIAAGNWDAVVLRLDDQTVRLSDLRSRAEELSSQAGLEEPPTPEAVLDELRREVVLYRWCVGSGAELTTEQEARVDRAREQALRETYRAELARRKVSGDPETLETYYERNLVRFSSPLRLRLRRLEVPVGSAAPARMRQLEDQVGAVRIGARTLEEMAEKTGGTVEEVGWTTLTQLEVAAPKAAWHAANLGTDRVSPPFRVGDTLQVLELLEREAPRPLPLDRVRGRVESAYLVEHARQLYDDVMEDLLADAGYVLDEGRLLEFLEAQGITVPDPTPAD